MADRGRGRGYGRGRGCGHDQELPPPPPMTIEQLIMIQTQVMQGMTQAVTTMHQAQQQPLSLFKFRCSHLPAIGVESS